MWVARWRVRAQARSRPRPAVALQVLLVVLTALLSIATNYATGDSGGPWPLRVLHRFAVPGVALFMLALVVVTVLSYRAGRPSVPVRVWDRDRTPYPGLEAFAEDEAAVFFGRDELIHRLVGHAFADDPNRLVVITGASGSGKSSLVRAGVLPRLRGKRWLVLPPITPETDPVGNLARALGGDPRRLRLDRRALVPMLRRLRDQQARTRAHTVVVVDQAEELFTLTGEQERSIFLDAIDHALTEDSRLWVVLTVRIEYLRGFLETSHAQRFSRPTAIGALSRADLVTVISEPAALVGLEFAPGLVARIVDDIGTADALPLLAYLLQELYFVAQESRVATFEHYQRLGGVGGALSRQADEAMAGLRDDAGAEPILGVLLKFVTIDEGEAIRRPVPLTTLDTTEHRVVEAFVDARLLVTDVDGGIATAQVAHEALFRQWAPLRQEVQARADQLRQRAELERWARDWQRSGHNPDYLLTGDRLRVAKQRLDSLGGLATEAIRAFVDASTRRDLNFLRRVSEGIGEYVLAHAQLYPELSALLSLAALSECPPTPMAVRALMSTLSVSHLTDVLGAHTDAVRNLAWSPDGSLIATAARDGTCGLWRAADGGLSRLLAGHASMVEMVAWSPDSTRVATASRDNTIRVWDIATGATVAVLTGATDVVRAVAWSPDGHLIAGGSRDRVIRLWDTDSFGQVGQLRGHTDNILGLAFSPTGDLLASGCHDHTARVWNIATRTTVTVLEGHEDFVEGVGWSPDGTRLASAGGDATLRIWEPHTGRQTLLIRCHEDRVWNLAWSPHGDWIASCGGDHTARIWNPNNAEELFVLRGHTSDVWTVAWSPDQTRLATGSADTTTRLWDVSPRGAETRQFTGHRGPVRTVAVGLDGDLLLSCGDDATVRTWVPATPHLIHAFTAHLDQIRAITTHGRLLASCSMDNTVSTWRCAAEGLGWDTVSTWTAPDVIEVVAFSPNGRLLAVGGHDRVVRVATVVDGAAVEFADVGRHQDWVTGLAWSSDATMLASTSDDRTVRLWRIESGAGSTGVRGSAVAVLRGHDNWGTGVCFSPESTRVASSSADGTARIWDVRGAEPLAVLDSHRERVCAVAWSPDGRRIATCSYDRTVRLWDAESYREIAVIGVHRDRVTAVAWMPDGRRVVSGSFDGTVRIWPVEVDLGALKARARGRVFRTLTTEERMAHLLAVPVQ